MTTTVITPNGVIVNSNWTPVGGTLDAVLADSNDATYADNSGGFGAFTELSLSTFTIAAGSFVSNMFVNVRCGTPVANVRYVDLKLNAPTQGIPGNTTLQLNGSRLTVFSSSSPPGDYVSSGFGACFDGLLNQGELDNMSVVLRDLGDPRLGTNDFRVYKLTVSIVTNVIPTATGSTIAFGTGALPVITWTTVNTDGVLCSYRAKIWTQAQTLDPFFDPNTVAPVWDSGTVLTTSTAPSATVTTPLTPGVVYVVGIQMGAVTGFTKTADGSAPPTYVTSGSWALSNPLTITPIAPARPFIGLTDQPNNVVGGPRVQIAVKAQDNIFSLAQYQFLLGIGNISWNGLDANSSPAIIGAGSPLLGTNVIQWTRTTSIGDLVAVHTFTGAAGTLTALQAQTLLPVVAGQVYAVFAQVKSPGTTRSAQTNVDWYDASGTFLSTTNSGNITTSTSTWKAAGGTHTAPANAAFARANIRFLACAISEVQYMHIPVFRPYDNGDAITDNVIHPAGAGFRGTGNKLNYSMSDAESVGSSFGTFSNYANVTSLTSTVATSRLRSRVWRHTNTATGQSTFRAAFNGVASSSDQPYPIAPGQTTVYASAWAKPSAVTGLQLFITIQFFSTNAAVPFGATGPSLLSQVTSPGVASTTANFTQISLQAPVPAGAVSFMVLFGFVSTGASQVMDWDSLQIGNVNSEFYQDGGFNGIAVGTTGTNNDQYERIFYLERSADGGVTWLPVRTAYKVPYGGTVEPQTLTINDYEIIAGVAYQYRSSEIGYFQGFPFYSTYYTANVTPALTTSGTSPNRWWLKDPITPANSMQVDILEDALVYQVMEAQTEYEPLGHNRHIVIADVVYGKDFNITFDFISPSEYAAWTALRATQRTLLLQRQWNGDSWYIRIGATVKVTETNSTPVRYLVECTAVEVDVPPV